MFYFLAFSKDDSHNSIGNQITIGTTVKPKYDAKAEGLRLARTLLYASFVLSFLVAIASLLQGKSVIAVGVSWILGSGILAFGLYAINRELRRRDAVR